MTSGPYQNYASGRALNPNPFLTILVWIHLQGQKHLCTEDPGPDSSQEYSSRHANEDGWLNWKRWSWGFFKAPNGEWDLISSQGGEKAKQELLQAPSGSRFWVTDQKCS